MIEAFKSDDIVKKVGGRFRLTALIQKRMKELIEGARPLVDSRGKVLLEVVVQEIMEDKIAVDYGRSKNLKPPDQVEMAQEIHGKGLEEPEEE